MVVKMEVEEDGANGGTGGAWTEEDRNLSTNVLGRDAFAYLTKGGGAISEGLVAASLPVDLQNKLQELIESEHAGPSWNYAIFWQLSRTKSGDLVLGWGDGSCREPHDGEVGAAASTGNDDARQRMRKRVLQRLHTAFGGADEEDYAPGIDQVTDTEMFFLASMYFAFPRRAGGPGQVFAAGVPLWIPNSERNVFPANYCYRGYLASMAGFKTILLLPFETGVLELGSMQQVAESSDTLQTIKSVFAGTSDIKDTVQRREGNGHIERSPGLAKIFGKDLNLGRSSAGPVVGVPKVDERPWEQRAASGGTSLLSNVQKGLQNFTWSQARGLNSHQQKFDDDDDDDDDDHVGPAPPIDCVTLSLDLHMSSNLETMLQDDEGPSTNITSRRSAPIDVVTRSPDLLVPSHLETILQDQSSRPHDIPLQDLKEITDNFSDERILGQGGFGVVYKGVLPNGKMIAVKKIVSSLMPGLQKQFESEVYHLMMLNHPNIVRCIGYCYEIRNACLEYNGKYVFAETAERLLCLEYMPKGSLDKYLSDESCGLDWSTRYNIIEGICYGLCYLHEKMDKPIIHLDLKPANILLDDGMVPKITDFGLSRLLDQQQTICTSSLYGTLGYMAPEFLHGGTITPKSDIFSLGVIIMEIVTGHRDYPNITRTSSDDFIELKLEKWRNVLQRSPGYGSLERDCDQIKSCLQVGLICVNPDRTKRPPMTKVISMLQGSESIDFDISKEAA